MARGTGQPDREGNAVGMTTSVAVTHGIRVEVRAGFVPERSNGDEGTWLFAYHVRIANDSGRIVQLVSRRWVITDALGRQEVVEGPGVVGQQPILGPGESHEYTSFCPLGTPFGSMEGSYRMVPRDGTDPFDAAVAPFALAEPFSIN